MKTYEKYKPSGIEWIGDIPEHWKVKKLKFITKVNSTALAEKQKEDFTIKYIDISSVNSNGGIIQTADFLFSESPSRARRIVKANDTIVSTVRTYLKAIAFIEKDVENLICSTGFAVIRPDEDIKGKFLFSVCFSNYFIEAVVSLSKGVSYPAIDSEDVNNILIWIPTLPEQTAIADYLDEKTAEIDKLIANKQRLIELLKEERTAIINKAVTRGINADAKLKPSGIDWLGDIPEHWEVKRFKFIAKIKYGLGQPPNQKDDGLPLIRATNVERGRIVEKDLIFVDPEDIPYDRDPILKENDIIIVRSGAYTADSAIIPKKYDGAIAGYDMVARVYEDSPVFISYCLLSNYVLINQLYLERLRAAQPHLNKEELGETLILLPKIEEQKEIVEFIESKTNEIDSTISKIKKEIELIKEYRTALISEVVTGKIKVC